MPELKVIQPRFASRRSFARLRAIGLRLYRLLVVVAIVCLVRRQQIRLRIDGDDPIAVEEVRAFFPAAARLQADPSERSGLWVQDRDGIAVGYVLRTSPASDRIIGFCGPTDTLVALTPDKKDPRVVGIKVRSSADTKQHVADVVADGYFMGTWDGKAWDEVAGMDPITAKIEGVSGASLTSRSIANGIRRRFEQSLQQEKALAQADRAPIRIDANDAGLAAVIVMAVLFNFTRLRSRTWLRRTFQIGLIGYVGLINGRILAQSLLAGWAASTIPWRASPGLVLLAAAALGVPWATRRQLYCSNICPHGAAQELIGRVSHRWMRRPPTLPAGIARGLRWLPPLLVALVLFVTMQHLSFSVDGIEPFDAYRLRTAGAATVAVAIAGLVAAAFVPMAYCKYGCPTGMVLSFVRSHGKADHFSRRDLAAGAMVLFVIALYTWHDPLRRWLIR